MLLLQDVEVETADGVKLHAWLLYLRKWSAEEIKSKPVILFFQVGGGREGERERAEGGAGGNRERAERGAGRFGRALGICLPGDIGICCTFKVYTIPSDFYRCRRTLATCRSGCPSSRA